MKGPSEFTMKVCNHCDDHEQVMITSKPTYHHYCKNTEVQKKFIIKKAKEYIGETSNTPSWCPYFKAK